MTPATAFRTALGQDVEGFSKVLSIHDQLRHLTVYLSDDGKELVVGFDSTQGTVWPPSRDWLSNLFAWPKTTTFGSSHCLAHTGFVDEYATVRKRVQASVAEFQPKLVRVVGFSQGGAHATLCFRDLLYNFPKLTVHGLAFASPRVYEDRGAVEFDYALSLRPECSFQRINAWGDPVPSLVPWFLGYKHVARCQHIGKFTLIPNPAIHGGEPYLNLVEQTLG